MSPIRIPTPDAPAAHHLTFICAVTELTHRVLERVTGLKIGLRVSVYDHINPERQPAIVEAARAAGFRYDESSLSAWYDWQPPATHLAEVTVFTRPSPKPAPTMQVVLVEPETNAELRQYSEADAAVMLQQDLDGRC